MSGQGQHEAAKERLLSISKTEQLVRERETLARNRAVMRRQRVVFDQTKVRCPG